MGVWLREAALLVGTEWRPSRRAHTVLTEIADEIVAALNGIFVDRDGRTARLEVSAGAVCWTDRPAVAVQWIVETLELPVPL